jgi:hypothetical protein
MLKIATIYNVGRVATQTSESLLVASRAGRSRFAFLQKEDDGES